MANLGAEYDDSRGQECAAEDVSRTFCLYEIESVINLWIWGGIVLVKCTFGIIVATCPFTDTITNSLGTGEYRLQLWIGVRKTMSLITTLQSSVQEHYDHANREHMDKLGLHHGRTTACQAYD